MKHQPSLSTIRNILLVLVLLCFFRSYAQEGSYLISSHTLFSQDNLNFDMVLSDNGNAYIATKNGLVKYNGQFIELIDTKGAMLSVAMGSDGTVYCGGVGSFGRLVQANNSNTYQAINAPGNQVIFELLIYKNELYALSSEILFKYNIDTGELHEVKDQLAGHFYALFELDNKVMVTTENKGTLELVGNKLVTTEHDLAQNKDISFAVRNKNTGKYLVGTYNNEIFISSDAGITPVANTFIDGSTINCGIWLDDNQIVLGTTFDGLGIVELDSLTTNEIGYSVGLQTTNIKQICIDKSGNLISLGQELLELVALNLPIKSFRHYQGLQGNPQAIGYFQDKVLIGTDRGLYGVAEVKEYGERQREITRSVIEQTRQKEEEIDKRKGLFKKRRREEVVEEEKPQVKNVTRVVTEKVLLSTRYEYQRIKATGHIDRITVRDKMLYASGLSGLFMINATDTVRITSMPANYFYVSDNGRLMFVCGDEQVKTFVNVSDNWVESNILTDFWDNITHIMEFDNKFWMCGAENVHSLTIQNNMLADADMHPISNPFFDKILAYRTNDNIAFVSKNNHYEFNTRDSLVSTVVKYDRLLLDNNNRVWGYAHGKWERPGKEEEHPVLSGLGPVVYIFEGANYFLGAITQHGEALRFNSRDSYEFGMYSPYLYSIKNNELSIDGAKAFEIEQQNSQLAFQIVHPDFTMMQKTQYRYLLNGLNQEWSEWSPDGVVEFSFLPPGEYELLVEARTAQGQVYQLNPVFFNVSPPYWEQPLFYAFEVAVILALLLVSVKLRSYGEKYKIVSTLLAFLVLAIVIEGVEAIMGSMFNMGSSPFFSFGLQVITALILFPFEGLLRKYILEKPVVLKKRKPKKISTKIE